MADGDPIPENIKAMQRLLGRIVEGDETVFASAIARIEAIILLRTQQGKFLARNGTTKAGYSKGHARRRKKKGLQTDKVDMFWTGQMLAGMRSEVDVIKGATQIHFGYLEGQSEEEASRIAEYHNVSGAGTNHVIRRFIGLTKREEADVFRVFKKDLLDRL